MTLSSTQLKRRVWRLRASVFRVMVFIEAPLIMDCRIKMSLLMFKSPFERVGSFSLRGLEKMTIERSFFLWVEIEALAA